MASVTPGDPILSVQMQLNDNAAATDEHRALNYLVMRYPAIYARAVEAFAEDFSLTGWKYTPRH
jgi:cyclic patellamide precursor peptide PatG